MLQKFNLIKKIDLKYLINNFKTKFSFAHSLIVTEDFSEIDENINRLKNDIAQVRNDIAEIKSKFEETSGNN